jgi:hypothetical protein
LGAKVRAASRAICAFRVTAGFVILDMLGRLWNGQ